MNTRESSLESDLPDDLCVESDRSIPWPVFACAAIVTVFAGFTVMTEGELRFPPNQFQAWFLAISGLYVVGLFVPRPWAWRVCRVVGLLAGVLDTWLSWSALDSKLANMHPEGDPQRFLNLVMAVPLLLLGVLLEFPSARNFYNGVCPRCFSRWVRPGQIIFESMRCRNCGHRW